MSNFTTVSGTVSASGVPWANGSFSVTFVPTTASQQHLLAGGHFQKNYVGTLGSDGSFTVVLPDNAQITPTGSKWRFYFVDASGKSQFHIADQTITGSTQSLSTTIQAAATAIAASGTPAGSDQQVQFNDAGAVNGDAGLTYAKSTATLTATNMAGGLSVPTGKTVSTTDADAVVVGGKKLAQTWTVHAISNMTTPATAAFVYIAPRACKVVSIKEVHSASATGVTIALRKITDASAPSATAGATVVEQLQSAFAADSTANTVVSGTLSATASDITFAAGDKLAYKASAALTSYLGAIVVEFQAV